MTTYKHIVQVHPIENDEPNLYKVREEFEFNDKNTADNWAKTFNEFVVEAGGPPLVQAVYRGRVNEETGELE